METHTSFEEQILHLLAGAIPGKFKKIVIERKTLLQRELGMDSLGILSLVFRFEEAFGIDLAKMDLKINIAKLRTVGDVIDTSRDILEQARAIQSV